MTSSYRYYHFYYYYYYFSTYYVFYSLDSSGSISPMKSWECLCCSSLYLSTQNSAWDIVGVQSLFVTWRPPGNSRLSAEQFENLCPTPCLLHVNECIFIEYLEEHVTWPVRSSSPVCSVTAWICRGRCLLQGMFLTAVSPFYSTPPAYLHFNKIWGM